MDNLKSIIGIVILEKSGRKIVSNYNENGSLCSLPMQLDFESKIIEILNSIFQNTDSQTHVMTFLKNILVVGVYKDFYIIVIADDNENEILLADMLTGIQDSLNNFCGKDITSRLIYKHYADVILLLHEIIDNGLILTLNSEELVARVLMQDSRSNRLTPGSSTKAVRGFFNFA